MSHHVEIKFEDRFEGICKTVLSGFSNRLRIVDLSMPLCNEAFDCLARANGQTEFFILGANLVEQLPSVSRFTPKPLEGNRYHAGEYDGAFGKLPVFVAPFPPWTSRLSASTLDIDIRSRVGFVRAPYTEREIELMREMSKSYADFCNDYENKRKGRTRELLEDGVIHNPSRGKS